MASNTDGMQLQGPARAAALAAFEAKISEWGIHMPPVEPLVLDFGLGTFDKVGLIEYWLANVPLAACPPVSSRADEPPVAQKAGYCGKYLFVFPGQECPAHSHQVKHETFCAVRGRLRVTVDSVPHVLKEGHTLPVAPGQVHTFRGEDGYALLLELSMPCDPRDNVFEDPAIRRWLDRALRQG